MKINTEYDIEEAFAAIEDELISSMMRNMKHHKVEEVNEDKQWTMWQAEQLKALERYRTDNRKRFKKEFSRINKKITELIRQAHLEGGMEQEEAILQAIKKGFKTRGRNRSGRPGMTGEFFKLNEKKLEALTQATVNDMDKAETAILRMADDQYRKIIYNAQVYANTGAGTYEKAVDMATRDFLAAGLNCVEYANGARHTLSDYADMAIKTATKRAYLQGEGEKRQEWGVCTVIVNKRGNPCPKCLPFCGKVLIDDVWSGGPSDGRSPESGIRYPLMSQAIEAGYQHPRCKDIHTTYFEGISTPPDDTYTRDEINDLVEQNRREAKQQHAKRQAEKYDRMAKYSLDEENQRIYQHRADEWKDIAKEDKSGIINIESVKEVSDVHSIGKIDREIYKCVTNDIATEEVIITDERIGHIKERHPNDYDKYYMYLKSVVENPDYIVESNKPNTALILKEIKESDEKCFKTVLRLITSTDNPEFKNSIITFMKINEKEWGRMLRNKKILYRKE